MSSNLEQNLSQGQQTFFLLLSVCQRVYRLSRIMEARLSTEEKVKIVRLYTIHGECALATRKALYQEGVDTGK